MDLVLLDRCGEPFERVLELTVIFLNFVVGHKKTFQHFNFPLVVVKFFAWLLVPIPIHEKERNGDKDTAYINVWFLVGSCEHDLKNDEHNQRQDVLVLVAEFSFNWEKLFHLWEGESQWLCRIWTLMLESKIFVFLWEIIEDLWVSFNELLPFELIYWQDWNKHDQIEQVCVNQS